MKALASLSPAQFDCLWRLHPHFLNKSEVMILKDSALVNHRVPTRAGNLLVINLESPNKYNSSFPAVSWQLSTGKTGIEALRKITRNSNIEISYDDSTNLYYFISDEIEVSIPRLDDQKLAFYQYDDVPNVPLETCDPPQPSERLTRQGIKEEYNVLFPPISRDDPLLSVFSKARYVDLLIRDKGVIGLQYGDVLITYDYYLLGDRNKIKRHDADFILRSHAFLGFKVEYISDLELSIARDAVGNYWLISRGYYHELYMAKRSTPEERVPPDFTAYEHLEVVLR